MIDIKMNDIKIGDYVFASRWADGDWNDPWIVGFISEIGNNYVCVCTNDADKTPDSTFRNCKLIDRQTGDRILQYYPGLEGSTFDMNLKYEIFGSTV